MGLPGIVAILAFSLVIPASRMAAQSVCRGPDDRSRSLIVELSNWMVTTDPERIAHRDTLYKIPVVAPAAIQLVTDDSVCVQARRAYAAPGEGPVYVLKLGTQGFAVLDPAFLAGEFETVKIFATIWKLVGGFTG